MAPTASDIPLSIERLVEQIRRVDAEYAALKSLLAGTDDESVTSDLQRSMAHLKNRRVTLFGEISEWLPTASQSQRARVRGAVPRKI